MNIRRTELPSPALALLRSDLWAQDVREMRVEVVRDSTTRLTLWEPVSFTAPSVARPYCCLLNTVIFYFHPHRLAPDGRSFLAWEERATLLKWDADFRFDGMIYRCGGGRVMRHKGGWWMKRWARIREDAYLNLSAA